MVIMTDVWMEWRVTIVVEWSWIVGCEYDDVFLGGLGIVTEYYLFVFVCVVLILNDWLLMHCVTIELIKIVDD